MTLDLCGCPAASWPLFREHLVPAWESNLACLRYCLWCWEHREDPLEWFPRFKGGATARTMLEALRRASRHARALHRLAYRRPGWETLI